MGAMEAGIRGRYGILVSKSVIDGVMAISFASALGLGVAFSAAPLLSTAAMTEMSAVGDPHRGRRPQYAGPGPGKALGGEHAPRHLPPPVLPAPGGGSEGPLWIKMAARVYA